MKKMTMGTGPIVIFFWGGVRRKRAGDKPDKGLSLFVMCGRKHPQSLSQICYNTAIQIKRTEAKAGDIRTVPCPVLP